MYLGIDVGTSSVKAVLIDENDKLIAQGSAPLMVSRPQPLWSEQAPNDWWDATVAAVQALPADKRKQVKGIGLSGQMHGATLLDEKDQPLRPAILWNDGRCEAECKMLEAREPNSRKITGNIAMPGFTAGKLIWVAEHEPEVFSKVKTVLLPKDFVRLQLTGEKISDMSDSAGTLWLDVAKRDWSDDMLAATGLKRSHMPSLVEGSAPAGKVLPDVAKLLGIPAGTVVAGGGGDNAASAVGLGVVKPGQAFLSLGTSGVLFAVTDKFRPNAEKAAHAFCHALPGVWHQMAVILAAASTLDWVRDLCSFKDIPDVFHSAEARGYRKDSPVFLPYLSGERTPHNDPAARGVFFGMSAATEKADLAHAVMEGVAFAFADGLDVLSEAGTKLDEISMTGGGARIPYWGKLLSSALNKPVTYREGGEVGAAFGAARLGRLAHTGENPESVCVMPPITTVVEPESALAEQLASRRQIYISLYQNLKKTFREYAK